MKINNFNLFIQSGCRINHQANVSSNFENTYLFFKQVLKKQKYTNSWECWIDYSCFYKNSNKLILKTLKNKFIITKSLDVLIIEITPFLLFWLLLFGFSDKNRRFIDNVIHSFCWLWLKKKYHRISKTELYLQFFKKNSSFINFSVLKSRILLKKLNIISFFQSLFFCNFLTKDFRVFFSNRSLNLQFNNVNIQYDLILKKLLSLNASGIYCFHMTKFPFKFYLGSSVNLDRRFKAHFREDLSSKKHPKFYSYVRKYGWDSFAFQVIEVTSATNFLEREQYWLSLIFNCSFLSHFSLTEPYNLSCKLKLQKINS